MSSSHPVLIVALVAVVALGGMYVMSSAITNVPLALPSQLSQFGQGTLTGAQTADVLGKQDDSAGGEVIKRCSGTCEPDEEFLEYTPIFFSEICGGFIGECPLKYPSTPEDPCVTQQALICKKVKKECPSSEELSALLTGHINDEGVITDSGKEILVDLPAECKTACSEDNDLLLNNENVFIS